MMRIEQSSCLHLIGVEMRYRIIWVDDSRQWVDSVRDELVETFTDKGFDPILEEYQEIGADVQVQIDSNYSDLIILDCNLPGKNGDVFIRELRDSGCYAHIIFYSNNEENLNLIKDDDHFINITPRSDIIDTVEGVVNEAYRKYNHPSFKRGLLLSEFIDLESLMNDFISSCFKSESEFFMETVINKGGESYSLSTKFKFISRVLKDSKAKKPEMSDEIESIGFTSNKFNTKILQRRNILAHAHPKYNSESGKITLVSAFDDVDFTSDWFFDTRNYIHDHKNMIKKMISLDLCNVVNPEVENA
ncbi:Response regulator [Vibrio chagasii]|nr:Response regulator [Vibrio chagasii]CAH6967894.1 Response regulator [Vibrio chagasii]CAH7139786.1 Response regulator [Vibrio chagasii]CAH7362926.1 Response regulator [Vibrio chagasii]CAH7432602.1 Response regulator [Vibrio chagasii]